MRVQKRYVFQFNQEEDFIGKINCRSTLTLTFPKRLWLDLLEDNHVNRIVLVSCMASHKIQKLYFFGWSSWICKKILCIFSCFKNTFPIYFTSNMPILQQTEPNIHNPGNCKQFMYIYKHNPWSFSNCF